MLVKWKAVKKVAKPVIQYALYYSVDDEKTTDRINITTNNDHEKYEYTLTKLNQLTTYYIYLSATNSYGEGQRSKIAIEKTLPVGKGTLI